MNDHDYPSDENSHFGLSTALLDEMPPQDFENEDGHLGFDLTIKNLLISLVAGLVVIFFVFGVFS
jgi:hypothetical protein